MNPDIPLHFSRYYPCYKMTNPPTPIEKLKRAREIALQKIQFVYLGNVITDKDTICPKCSSVLIKRSYGVSNKVIENSCPSCGHKIYGKF